MQAQQAGLQQQQGSHVGTEQTGPTTQDPSEPGWQDTGSEDFMDAWSDDDQDDDESEGYAADHVSGGQEHDQLLQLQPHAQQQLHNHPQQEQEQQQQHDQQRHLEDQVQQQQQHQQGAQPQDLEMQTQNDLQGQQQQQQAGDLADLVLRLPPQELQRFLLQLDEQGFDIADIEAGSEASSSGGGSSDGSQDHETDELQPADTGTLWQTTHACLEIACIVSVLLVKCVEHRLHCRLSTCTQGSAAVCGPLVTAMAGQSARRHQQQAVTDVSMCCCPADVCLLAAGCTQFDPNVAASHQYLGGEPDTLLFAHFPVLRVS